MMKQVEIDITECKEGELNCFFATSGAPELESFASHAPDLDTLKRRTRNILNDSEYGFELNVEDPEIIDRPASKPVTNEALNCDFYPKVISLRVAELSA